MDLKAIRVIAEKESESAFGNTYASKFKVFELLDHIKTLTDALQEIKECTELFYDGMWLKPGLSPHAGPINVICKVTENALKEAIND